MSVSTSGGGPAATNGDTTRATSGDTEVAARSPSAGVRAVVLRGGVPTAEQAAALAAALLSLEVATTSTSPGVGGWQRAALLEGVGGPTISQRADLERPGQR